MSDCPMSMTGLGKFKMKVRTDILRTCQGQFKAESWAQNEKFILRSRQEQGVKDSARASQGQ
jgi:hypothetical protein